MDKAKRIWLSPPHLGDDEYVQVTDAFRTNWIAPVGPHIDKFEEEICSITMAEHAVALSSGTAAIHLALIMLGVERGDEVIVSTLTFAASVNPIIYQGATPVFVDSESITANMDPDLLEEAIKSRIASGKKPKAIILVHLYGMPAQLGRILEISQKYRIPIIEDAAEALGATYRNRMLGTFGLMGIYSFNGNKIITTAGGGCIISGNKSLTDKARKLSSQARDPAPHYQHSEIGYNYRISNICAAIGIGQLKVLPKRVEQRRGNFEHYRQTLSEIQAIKFIDEPGPEYYSNRWLSWIIIDPGSTPKATPGEILTSLEKLNIESRPLWKPMHLQPVFADYPYYGDGYSEWLFENSLCLPSGSNLTHEQLDKIVVIIKSCFGIK